MVAAVPESDRVAPPPGFYMLLEGRLAAEASALLLQLPMLRMMEPGGTGDVLVLPGFMADDSATWLLRRFLNGLGYDVHPWSLGVNRGAMLSYLPLMLSRIETLARETGEPPSLVGWSRGGVLARELARERPDLVRSVVTLGSPVRGGVHGTSIGRWVAREAGMTIERINRVQQQRQRRPIETPITAIYSRTDGVVSWQAARDEASPNVEHVEVPGSHVGLVVNAQVYRQVARALARYHGRAR
ncbi:MAG: alpha/beta hydrolase [Pseudomonadales bacterium]